LITKSKLLTKAFSITPYDSTILCGYFFMFGQSCLILII